MNRERISKAFLEWAALNEAPYAHGASFHAGWEAALRSLESAEPTNREKIYGPLLEKPAAKTNQCGETCERAKLCYACGKALDESNAKLESAEPVAIAVQKEPFEDGTVNPGIQWNWHFGVNEDSLPVGTKLYADAAPSVLSETQLKHLLEGVLSSVEWTPFYVEKIREVFQQAAMLYAAPAAAPEAEPRLVSYAPDMQTCTLAVGENQFLFDRHTEAPEAVSVPVEWLEALVQYNGNARSFFQIANRIATQLGTHALQTNFGAFAESTGKMLKETHDITNKAREMLAAAKEGKHD